MTLMAFLQIIYLTLNIVGVTLSFYVFLSEADFSFVFRFFDFINARLGKIALIIVSTIFIIVFLPALAFIAAAATFIMILGNYSN
jgi:hypothetical protein